MNERLKKLFSPEKLREKWKTKPVPKASKSQNNGLNKISDVRDEFNQISHLILNQYSGNKRKILKILLDDIKKELDKFITISSDNNQSAGVAFAVIEQINQLEDLIEAF